MGVFWGRAQKELCVHRPPLASVGAEPKKVRVRNRRIYRNFMRLYGVCAKMQGYLGALCAALI